MDKTVVGILGALGALVAAAPVQAAPATGAVLAATNYADLLRPIPNARETLRALDQADAPDARYQEAQIVLPGVVIRHGHHHHHHHHRYYRRRYHHHHHRYDHRSYRY